MLTVLGEAIVDLVGEGDRRYRAHPGGSPLNVAVGLGRLGQPVSLAKTLRQASTWSSMSTRRASFASRPKTVANTLNVQVYWRAVSSPSSSFQKRAVMVC